MGYMSSMCNLNYTAVCAVITFHCSNRHWSTGTTEGLLTYNKQKVGSMDIRAMKCS